MYGFCLSFSDVDVDITGVSNNTLYSIQNDSVVLQDDHEKYACSDDECVTDSDS